MGLLSGLIGGNVAKPIEVIGDVLDDLFTSDDERAEARAKLMQMAQDGKLKELDLLVQDRDGARQREMALGGHMNAILGIMIVLGFFCVLGWAISGRIPTTVDQMYVGALLGTLGTMAVQVVAYYFGSSAGSKQKTHLLGKK